LLTGAAKPIIAKVASTKAGVAMVNYFSKFVSPGMLKIYYQMLTTSAIGESIKVLIGDSY
jgi:hypothetical protein